MPQCMLRDRFWWCNALRVLYGNPGTRNNRWAHSLLGLFAHEAEANDAVDSLASRAHVEEAGDRDIAMRNRAFDTYPYPHWP